MAVLFRKVGLSKCPNVANISYSRILETANKSKYERPIKRHSHMQAIGGINKLNGVPSASQFKPNHNFHGKFLYV